MTKCLAEIDSPHSGRQSLAMIFPTWWIMCIQGSVGSSISLKHLVFHFCVAQDTLTLWLMERVLMMWWIFTLSITDIVGIVVSYLVDFRWSDGCITNTVMVVLYGVLYNKAMWHAKITTTVDLASKGSNSLRLSDTIWQQRFGSTLAQVMACCLTVPSCYLIQCWFIIIKVQWHSAEGNFTKDTPASNHWN